METRKELTQEVSRRYQRSSRSEKREILNEFCRVIGYNRHYAAYLLRNHGRQVYMRSATGDRLLIIVGDKRMRQRRREYPRVYDVAFREYLVYFWEVIDYPCGKRLKHCLGPLVSKSRQFKERPIPRPIESKLKKVSAATIDRLLKVERMKSQLKCRSKTKPGTLLKKQIPVRSGMEWDEDVVGFTELDLVGHDGGIGGGDHAYTLNMTDIKSGWTEMTAVRNKAQVWTFDAIEEIKGRLPFELKGIDSDNGGEFINHHLLAYCREQNLVFTRSRPYHANDNCHVEQKNFTAVRNYVGHNRYDREEELALLNELYGYLRLYLNFFHPQMKLIVKERIGSKVKKKYDQPQTPYQRLINLSEVDEKYKTKLRATYDQLNPFELKRTIDKLQNRLFSMVYEKKKRGAPLYVQNQLKPALV